MSSKAGDGANSATCMTAKSPSSTHLPKHHSFRSGTKDACSSSRRRNGSSNAQEASDGINVVVRVRPLSLTEHADFSMRNCVQCLKDSVIVGAQSAITPSSLPPKYSSSSGGSRNECGVAGVAGSPLSRSSNSNTASKANKPKLYGTRVETTLRACQFHVDDVLHPHTTQIEVYERTCRRIVAGVFEGINGAILAYGATGSGKTHTMFGSTLSAAGIVYQSIQDIFAEKRRLELDEKMTVSIRCSFVEIYNEEVFDLLAPSYPQALRRMQQQQQQQHGSSSSGHVGSPHKPKSSSVPGSLSSTSASTGVTDGSSTGSGTGATVHASDGDVTMLNNGSMNNYGVHDGTNNYAVVHPRTPLQVCTNNEKPSSSSASQSNPESLVICGLTYIYPNSLDDFSRAIAFGHANRFTASTGANAQSSRSHAIITVEVRVAPAPGSTPTQPHRSNGAESSEDCRASSTAARESNDSGNAGSSLACGAEANTKKTCAAVNCGTVARLLFCDLAGSERAASTSNVGIRLREAGNINRSLLALGAVVQSLVQRRRHPEKKLYIPFRGSKLTRLLRDGLSGNCRTQIIFCLSPCVQQYEESLNTMLFAVQARQVQVAARRNVFSVNTAQVAQSQEKTIEELREALYAAQTEIERLRGIGAVGVSAEMAALTCSAMPPLRPVSIPSSSHVTSSNSGNTINSSGSTNANLAVVHADADTMNDSAVTMITKVAASTPSRCSEAAGSHFWRARHSSVSSSSMPNEQDKAMQAGTSEELGGFTFTNPHGYRAYSMNGGNDPMNTNEDEDHGGEEEDADMNKNKEQQKTRLGSASTMSQALVSSTTPHSQGECGLVCDAADASSQLSLQQQQRYCVSSSPPLLNSPHALAPAPGVSLAQYAANHNKNNANSTRTSRSSSVRMGPPMPGLATQLNNTRASVFTEDRLKFSEVEDELKTLTQEKDVLYRQMHDKQEQRRELDVRLRQQKWKLARFLASNTLSNRMRQTRSMAPPAALTAAVESCATSHRPTRAGTVVGCGSGHRLDDHDGGCLAGATTATNSNNTAATASLVQTERSKHVDAPQHSEASHAPAVSHTEQEDALLLASLRASGSLLVMPVTPTTRYSDNKRMGSACTTREAGGGGSSTNTVWEAGASAAWAENVSLTASSGISSSACLTEEGMLLVAGAVESDGLCVAVGVAGLRNMIARMEMEDKEYDAAMTVLQESLDRVDGKIAEMMKKLVMEKQPPALELLLDNNKLRQNCTEAECLAAHFHQECRLASNTQSEYAQALEMCVSALRSALPLLPRHTSALEEAKRALLYAPLPMTRTAELITVFENQLRVDNIPPLAPPPASAAALALSSVTSPLELQQTVPHQSSPKRRGTVGNTHANTSNTNSATMLMSHAPSNSNDSGSPVVTEEERSSGRMGETQSGEDGKHVRGGSSPVRRRTSLSWNGGGGGAHIDGASVSPTRRNKSYSCSNTDNGKDGKRSSSMDTLLELQMHFRALEEEVHSSEAASRARRAAHAATSTTSVVADSNAGVHHGTHVNRHAGIPDEDDSHAHTAGNDVHQEDNRCYASGDASRRNSRGHSGRDDGNAQHMDACMHTTCCCSSSTNSIGHSPKRTATVTWAAKETTTPEVAAAATRASPHRSNPSHSLYRLSHREPLYSAGTDGCRRAQSAPKTRVELRHAVAATTKASVSLGRYNYPGGRRASVTNRRSPAMSSSLSRNNSPTIESGGPRAVHRRRSLSSLANLCHDSPAMTSLLSLGAEGSLKSARHSTPKSRWPLLRAKTTPPHRSATRDGCKALVSGAESGSSIDGGGSHASCRSESVRDDAAGAVHRHEKTSSSSTTNMAKKNSSSGGNRRRDAQGGRSELEARWSTSLTCHLNGAAADEEARLSSQWRSCSLLIGRHAGKSSPGAGSPNRDGASTGWGYTGARGDADLVHRARQGQSSSSLRRRRTQWQAPPHAANANKTRAPLQRFTRSYTDFDVGRVRHTVGQGMARAQSWLPLSPLQESLPMSWESTQTQQGEKEQVSGRLCYSSRSAVSPIDLRRTATPHSAAIAHVTLDPGNNTFTPPLHSSPAPQTAKKEDGSTSCTDTPPQQPIFFQQQQQGGQSGQSQQKPKKQQRWQSRSLERFLFAAPSTGQVHETHGSDSDSVGQQNSVDSVGVGQSIRVSRMTSLDSHASNRNKDARRSHSHGYHGHGNKDDVDDNRYKQESRKDEVDRNDVDDARSSSSTISNGLCRFTHGTIESTELLSSHSSNTTTIAAAAAAPPPKKTKTTQPCTASANANANRVSHTGSSNRRRGESCMAHPPPKPVHRTPSKSHARNRDRSRDGTGTAASRLAVLPFSAPSSSSSTSAATATAMAATTAISGLGWTTGTKDEKDTHVTASLSPLPSSVVSEPLIRRLRRQWTASASPASAPGRTRLREKQQSVATALTHTTAAHVSAAAAAAESKWKNGTGSGVTAASLAATIRQRAAAATGRDGATPTTLLKTNELSSSSSTSMHESVRVDMSRQQQLKQRSKRRTGNHTTAYPSTNNNNNTAANNNNSIINGVHSLRKMSSLPSTLQFPSWAQTKENYMSEVAAHRDEENSLARPSAHRFGRSATAFARASSAGARKRSTDGAFESHPTEDGRNFGYSPLLFTLAAARPLDESSGTAVRLSNTQLDRLSVSSSSMASSSRATPLPTVSRSCESNMMVDGESAALARSPRPLLSTLQCISSSMRAASR